MNRIFGPHAEEIAVPALNATGGQYFTVLPGIRSVSGSGDGGTYDYNWYPCRNKYRRYDE